MSTITSSPQYPLETYADFSSRGWHTTFTDSSMRYYWGPCSCQSSVDPGIFDTGIYQPGAHSTVIAGEPTTVKWHTNSTGTDFTLKLYTYTGTCYIKDWSQSGKCVYRDIQTVGTFANIGEHEWTPSKNLESRIDYVLGGTSSDGRIAYYMGYFTILKERGDEPLVLPDPSDVQRNLSTYGSTSSVQDTISSTAPSSLSTFTGAVSTTKATGGSHNERHVSWMALIWVFALTWLCTY